MYRFYYENNINLNELVLLNKEESYHAIKVLRLKIGDTVEVLDGSNIYSCKIKNITNGLLELLVLEKLEPTEPQTKITLFQGIPKGDKLSTIVQKCTEIGVSSFEPIFMSRCDVKPSNIDKKNAKLNKVAIEAAKQSGRSQIPKVKDFKQLNDIADLKEYDLILVPWEEERNISIYDLMRTISPPPKNIAIFIGPEGGIDKTEIDFLTSLGAKTVSLGKRILRTENAGLCAAFGVLTLLNDL
ncbi:MAG: 16S rRNA (uracil(1498)-N(3))-methyltransferase [Christensenellaceae bacterium]|nr:16S rRNA (uracil(1498)-N(3))-methyltransferase [Christensenellaceae bacterium]